MELQRYIYQRLDRLNKLCDTYNVNRLYAFGSLVSGAFNIDTSDIDFQVELLPITDPIKGLYYSNYGMNWKSYLRGGLIY